MISDTEKYLWIREAAARLVYPKERKTSRDDIEAIMEGVKFLTINDDAKQLAYTLIDVAFERMGVLLSIMYVSTEDKAAIKKVAEELKINILTK